MTSELRALAGLFLKLGTVAFGGPAARIGMMEDEVVRRRQWQTREQFLDYVDFSADLPCESTDPSWCFAFEMRATRFRWKSEKLYQVIPDRAAAAVKLLRIVHESGEAYLYPAALFAPVNLPPALRRAVLAAV